MKLNEFNSSKLYALNCSYQNEMYTILLQLTLEIRYQIRQIDRKKNL